YKRVAGIAASIAGVTALTISSLVWSISPKPDNKKIQDLSRDLQMVKRDQRIQKNEVNNLKNQITVEPSIPYKSGGTGFLIDVRSLLVTNAQLVTNARNTAVQNKSAPSLNAVVALLDTEKDLALLKIEDSNYKGLSPI